MRLSFITQFKIEFLLPFTDCRKVYGQKWMWPVSSQYSKIDFFKKSRWNKLTFCMLLQIPES